VLFLAHDEDFVEATPDCKAGIIWSRVSQSVPIDRRVEIWFKAVKQFFAKNWNEKFFELYDDGQLHPVEVVKRQSPLQDSLSDCNDWYVTATFTSFPGDRGRASAHAEACAP
jgi:hypothetical protein